MTQDWLWDIPLIDTHVHRVHPNRTPPLGNLGGGYIPGPQQERFGRGTLLYGMIVDALRAKLDLAPDAADDAVEAARNQRYEADPQAYFRWLLQDCNVALHCVEVGSPIGGPSYTEAEIRYFNGAVPADRQCSIFRLDRLLDELLPDSEGLSQLEDRFRRGLWTAAAEERTVGLKSCAAYYGGLALEDPGRAAAEQAWETLQRTPDDGMARTILGRYFLYDSLDAAAEHRLPIQFHTGLGGGSWIHFQTMNPLHMVDFLRDERIRNRVRVVLLHGGHPHEEITSYLVSQFDHVYSDFSGMFYLSSLKGVERMAALLERAPLQKICYGSDGVMFPEYAWFAAHRFRFCLGKLLENMEENGALSAWRHKTVAQRFCWENALECYEKLQPIWTKTSSGG